MKKNGLAKPLYVVIVEMKKLKASKEICLQNAQPFKCLMRLIIQSQPWLIVQWVYQHIFHTQNMLLLYFFLNPPWRFAPGKEVWLTPITKRLIGVF